MTAAAAEEENTCLCVYAWVGEVLKFLFVPLRRLLLLLLLLRVTALCRGRKVNPVRTPGGAGLFFLLGHGITERADRNWPPRSSHQCGRLFAICPGSPRGYSREFVLWFLFRGPRVVNTRDENCFYGYCATKLLGGDENRDGRNFAEFSLWLGLLGWVWQMGDGRDSNVYLGKMLWVARLCLASNYVIMFLR